MNINEFNKNGIIKVKKFLNKEETCITQNIIKKFKYPKGDPNSHYSINIKQQFYKIINFKFEKYFSSYFFLKIFRRKKILEKSRLLLKHKCKLNMIDAYYSKISDLPVLPWHCDQAYNGAINVDEFSSPLKAKIKFADINLEDMNISINHIEKLITKKTKAIVFVNYGGLLCDLEKLQKIAKKHNIFLIQDAAQSLGAKYKGKEITEFADFTIFSFQAIKHITSGDGGALVCKNNKLAKKARIIRWFGIDRPKKQGGTWENDIVDIGYKYQMTDIGAALLLDSMKEFKLIKKKRNTIHNTYVQNLKNIKGVKCIQNMDKNTEPVIWLTTIYCERKDFLQKKLRKNLIESNQVHFRNDRYSIFKKFCKNKKFPNMDKVENKYLVIPTHTKMSTADAKLIAKNIRNILK